MNYEELDLGIDEIFDLLVNTPKHDLELAIVSSALFFVYGRRTLRTLQIVDTGAILAP